MTTTRKFRFFTGLFLAKAAVLLGLGTCGTSLARCALDRLASSWERIRYVMNSGDPELPKIGRSNIRVERITGDAPENYVFPKNAVFRAPDFRHVVVADVQPGKQIVDQSGRPWKVLDWWDDGIEVEQPINDKLPLFFQGLAFGAHFLGFGQKILALDHPAIPAHIYKLSISNPASAQTTEIEVVIPAVNGQRDEAKLRRIVDGIAALPFQTIEPVDVLRAHRMGSASNLYFRIHYFKFTAAAGSAGKGEDGRKEINLFPAIDDTFDTFQLLKVLRHEVGHIYALKKFGSTTPDEQWKEAMRLDGEVPSEYAKNSLAEDFAETFMLYLATDAGLTSPWVREKLRHRFELLDEIFEAHPELRKQARELQRKLREGIEVGVFFAIAGAAVTIPVLINFACDTSLDAVDKKRPFEKQVRIHCGSMVIPISAYE